MPLKDLSTRVVSRKEEKWPSIKVCPPPRHTYADMKSEVFLTSGSEPLLVRLEYYWNIRGEALPLRLHFRKCRRVLSRPWTVLMNVTPLWYRYDCWPVRTHQVFSQCNQQDETFHNLVISVRRSACFRRFYHLLSGAQNCTYSVRYLSDCNNMVKTNLLVTVFIIWGLFDRASSSWNKGRIRPPPEALDVKLQHTIFCCSLTSSAPDDGRMRPKHVELKKRH